MGQCWGESRTNSGSGWIIPCVRVVLLFDTWTVRYVQKKIFPVTLLGNTHQKKSVFLSGNVQRGGVQPESKSFEVLFFSPYFDQLLDIKGGGGGGLTMFQKFWGTFLSKYWEFWALKKLPHGCPKWADTKVTSQCPKWGGRGVEATFGQCPK